SVAVMTNGLPTWAGSVDAEALAQLLALGGERDWLDYKRQCDLSETRGVVEIVKDMGAMMVTASSSGPTTRASPLASLSTWTCSTRPSCTPRQPSTYRARLSYGLASTSTRASPSRSSTWPRTQTASAFLLPAATTPNPAKGS